MSGLRTNRAADQGSPDQTGTTCRSTSYGCDQRRLHVAGLGVAGDGRLVVADRG